MKTRQLTYKDLNLAAQILRDGGIIAFPTETVYGLGVIYDNKAAFDTLVTLKERRPDKPFTLMCGVVSDVALYAMVSPLVEKVLQAFLPGPLTIILPTKPNVPEWVHLKTGKVGIRVSSLQTIQALILKVGKPLLVPSANRADEAPALTPEDALAYFNDQIDAVVSGHVNSGTPSTVIDIDSHDNIRLVRQGTITLAQIEQKIKEQL